MHTHLGPFVSEFLAESEYARVSTHFQRQLICIFKTASKGTLQFALSNREAPHVIRGCQVFSVTDLSGGYSVFEKDGKLVEGFPPFFDRFGPLFSDVL